MLDDPLRCNCRSSDLAELDLAFGSEQIELTEKATRTPRMLEGPPLRPDGQRSNLKSKLLA